MLDATLTGGIGFLIGRLLYGGVLAASGLKNVVDPQDAAESAAAMDVPLPGLAARGTGVMLVIGGVAVAAGIAPVVGAGLLAVFFAVVTPTIHRFWAVEDPEERQRELVAFLKNVALLGGALVFLDLGTAGWRYAVGIGLL